MAPQTTPLLTMLRVRTKNKCAFFPMRKKAQQTCCSSPLGAKGCEHILREVGLLAPGCPRHMRGVSALLSLPAGPGSDCTRLPRVGQRIKYRTGYSGASASALHRFPMASLIRRNSDGDQVQPPHAQKMIPCAAVKNQRLGSALALHRQERLLRQILFHNR
jgi:hypothetical protein